MPEPTPSPHAGNPELMRLIADLENQIDGVSAGLAEIRSTVARISLAAGLAYSANESAWGGLPSVAPANRADWASVAPSFGSPADERETPVPPVPDVAPSPSPWPAEPAPPVDHAWWHSVAEGASWPRADSPHPPPEAPDPAPSAVPDMSPDVLPEQWSAQPAGDAVEQVEQPEETQQPEAPELFAVTEEASEQAWQTPQAPSPPEPAPEEEMHPTADAWSAGSWTPAATPPEMETEPQADQPSTSSFNWPAVSDWPSGDRWTGFNVGNRDTAAPDSTGNSSDEESRVDVSDIVAQVRAELEAARNSGALTDMAAVFDDEAGDANASEPGGPDAPMDDAGRRDAVSRTVAEIRQQLMQGGAGAFGDEDESPPEMAEDDESLRRNTGLEQPDGLGGEQTWPQDPPADFGAEKPAFRLAAPGAFPDWPQRMPEIAGPPVVVIKDNDGRVELASVFETLNELGCGDGAALLNYTPHSVTVGLPITTPCPSRERMAEAIEKVFGLSSQVEADGVRITVSVGLDPQRKSTGAA